MNWGMLCSIVLTRLFPYPSITDISDFDKGFFIQYLDPSSVYFYKPVLFEFRKEAYDRFGGCTNHIGQFFAGKGYLKGFFVVEVKFLLKMNNNFRKAFPNCFLGNIGNIVIGFTQFFTGNLKQFKCKIAIMPDKINYGITVNETNKGIL